MSLRNVTISAVVVGCAFVTGALAGCQHQAAEVAAAGGYGLHLIDDGASSKLAYGQANSDDVGLMLECAKGSGRIEVSDVQRGDDTTIRLMSGGAATELSASEQSFGGLKLLIAETRPSEDAFAAFEKTGDLKVQAGGLTYVIDADRRGREAVSQFLTACKSTQMASID